jgi:hypothetical protein
MRLCHGLLCSRTADVWMRGKAWCIPCSIKRFGFRTSATRQAEAAAPSVRPQERDSGLAENPFPPAGVPAPLSDDEVLDILERDGWRDIEMDLFTQDGSTLDDLARSLTAHLEGDLDLPKGTPS